MAVTKEGREGASGRALEGVAKAMTKELESPPWDVGKPTEGDGRVSGGAEWPSYYGS